jgi:hypothetical protein
MSYAAFAAESLFVGRMLFGRLLMTKISWVVELRTVHLAQHSLLFTSGLLYAGVVLIHSRMLHFRSPEKNRFALFAGRSNRCRMGLFAKFAIAQCVRLSKQKGGQAGPHQTKKPQHVLHS